MGLAASVAVASTPEAAMHAARGFRGVTVVPPGSEAERLGKITVGTELVASVGATAGDYPIPVAIVPGHLSDEELDAMT